MFPRGDEQNCLHLGSYIQEQSSTQKVWSVRAMSLAGKCVIEDLKEAMTNYEVLSPRGLSEITGADVNLNTLLGKSHTFLARKVQFHPTNILRRDRDPSSDYNDTTLRQRVLFQKNTFLHQLGHVCRITSPGEAQTQMSAGAVRNKVTID